MNHQQLFTPITLPCGVIVKNRFMKSAMSEGLATVDHCATVQLANLYQSWALGGAGLVITGNVMIDRSALGEPRNVVVENEYGFHFLERWAKAGTVAGTQLWMQLNHPGKQSPKVLSKRPVAPSALPLTGALASYFATPRELAEQEIHELIKRFAESARLAKSAGFTGVQIHAAHGYLLSQFLSPLHNQRKDRWGGSVENRMRFLTEVYQAIRAQVGNSFPIGVKINSADFERGGFSEEDSSYVIQQLGSLGIDLIEISGGTYESPVMTGVVPKENVSQSQRSRAREAYFLQFAEKVRQFSPCPIAVTGGFRTAEAMVNAIQSDKLDFIGLARPFAVEPQLPTKLSRGEYIAVQRHAIRTGVKIIDENALLETIWYEQQLARIAKGKLPQPRRSAWWTLISSICLTGWHIFQKRRSS